MEGAEHTIFRRTPVIVCVYRADASVCVSRSFIYKDQRELKDAICFV